MHDTILVWAGELRSPRFPDVLLDCPAPAAGSKERVGYPTQKPLALLERIVRWSTLRGHLVLDPFCGSGTTLVAAARLGRDWLGMDASPDAVAAASARLAAVEPPRAAVRVPAAVQGGLW
jgi:site-specific DNA-methyltransferase (adenine-specific)